MKWAIFDYGVGNLHSLRRGLERAGAKVTLTHRARDLEKAAVAVLPGVGAFGAVMDSLAEARDILLERHQDGRPILGICIGQHALYEGSDEDPDHVGLGIVPGRCLRLPPDGGKVPHMGWNQVTSGHPLFAGVPPDSHFYFVHSYYVAPDALSIAMGQYGVQFSAALQKDNTVAFQFHPEKSGLHGATVLGNVVEVLGKAATSSGGPA